MKTLSLKKESGSIKLSFVDKELKEIKPSEVLIKILYTGICGTDVKLASGKYPVADELFPLTIGHEFVGEIVQIGDGVNEYRVGDLVVGKPTLKSCGKCTCCRSGKVNMCSKRIRVGINTDGAFAEYIIFPASQLIKVNHLQKTVSGAWMEPVSVVARGIGQLKLNPNMNVCVLGPGPIGILAALMVKEFGANVTIVGQVSDQERLSFLLNEKMVDEAVAYWIEDNSFDCVIDCTGNEIAINNGLRWIKPTSQLLLLGTNKYTMSVNFSLIAYKELRVTGTLGANELDWDYALGFLERNEERLIKITKVRPFSEALDCFKKHQKLEAKTIIKF